MATMPEKDVKSGTLDLETVRAIIERRNARMGFVPIPNPSIQRIRELMWADGVRPEENLFSRGIIEMREE